MSWRRRPIEVMVKTVPFDAAQYLTDDCSPPQSYSYLLGGNLKAQAIRQVQGV